MKKKVNSKALCFILILAFMFIGSITSTLTYVSMGVCLIISLFLGFECSRKKSHIFPVGIMYLLCFQNFMIGLGAHILQNKSDSLKLMTQIPFMSIAIIWICIFFHNNKFRSLQKEKRAFFLLIACIAFSFVIGRGNLSSVLITVRNLIVFFMSFCIGYYNLDTERSLKEFQRLFLHLSMIMLVAGIILLVDDGPLYRAIGINEVYSAKTASIVENAYSSGVFRTDILHRRITRMGSLYYEPVNLGYFFSCAFLIAFFGNYTTIRIRKIAWILCTLLGLILTIGKGGYLITFAIVVCVYIMKYGKRISGIRKKTIWKIIILIAVMGLTAFSVYYYKNVGGVVNQHFWGIIGTFRSVLGRPIGYGLGVGGNAAKRFGNLATEWLESGGETALMSYFYQLGIVGGFMFIISNLSLVISIRKANMSLYYSMFCFIPIILIGISLLQDNTYTPQCITGFMLLQGSAKSILQQKKKLLSYTNLS